MHTVASKRTRSRATISDVARLAGVSIATVSRVLNETAPVAEETEARVRDAIAELSYKPQPAAQTLAGRRTNTIGLLLPELSSAFFTPLLRGVESGLRQSGFDMLIYATTHTANDEAGRLGPLGEHNTDGLLVFTNRLDDGDIRRLHEHGFPLVLLHRTPPAGLNIPCVTVENKAGTRRAVEHLIRVHGRRRIGFLAGPDGNEDSMWRLAGYREALQSHGLPDDAALVACGGFDDVLAYEAVERWLAEGVSFDALFAGDDDSAAGAILALRRAGKRVPDDVSVIGFDDVPFASYLQPPLTTVRAPIEDAGRAAAEQLVRLIQDGGADALTLLPTELIIRQSCGCGHP